MRARARILRCKFPADMAPSLRHVVLSLALGADEDGRGSLTVPELARRIGSPERSVARWLAELTTAGWFVRDSKTEWWVQDPDIPSGSTLTPRQGEPCHTVRSDLSYGQGASAPRAPGLREPDPEEDSELSETYNAFCSERETCASAREANPETGNGKPKNAKPKTWRFVPQPFEPTEDERTLAKRVGVNLESELARFLDHEFIPPRSDAHRAFRNWLRRSADFGPRNGKAPGAVEHEQRMATERTRPELRVAQKRAPSDVKPAEVAGLIQAALAAAGGKA